MLFGVFKRTIFLWHDTCTLGNIFPKTDWHNSFYSNMWKGNMDLLDAKFNYANEVKCTADLIKRRHSQNNNLKKQKKVIHISSCHFDEENFLILMASISWIDDLKVFSWELLPWCGKLCGKRSLSIKTFTANTYARMHAKLPMIYGLESLDLMTTEVSIMKVNGRLATLQFMYWPRWNSARYFRYLTRPKRKQNSALIGNQSMRKKASLESLSHSPKLVAKRLKSLHRLCTQLRSTRNDVS